MLLFLLIAWLATQAPKFPLRLPKLHLPKVRCLCCPKGDKDDVTTFVRPREDRRIRLNVSFTNILSSDVGSTPAHLLTPKAFNGSRLSDQFVHPLEVPSDEIPSSRLELPSPMTDSSKIVNESSMATRATQSTDSSRLFAIPDQVNVAEWKQHKASCKDSHHTSHHSASAMLAILPHSASALATPDTDSHDTVDTPVFPLGVDSTDTDTSTSKGSTSSSMPPWQVFRLDVSRSRLLGLRREPPVEKQRIISWKVPFWELVNLELFMQLTNSVKMDHKWQSKAAHGDAYNEYCISKELAKKQYHYANHMLDNVVHVQGVKLRTKKNVIEYLVVMDRYPGSLNDLIK
eukprot:833778_1